MPNVRFKPFELAEHLQTGREANHLCVAIELNEILGNRQEKPARRGSCPIDEHGGESPISQLSFCRNQSWIAFSPAWPKGGFPTSCKRAQAAAIVETA